MQEPETDSCSNVDDVRQSREPDVERRLPSISKEVSDDGVSPKSENEGEHTTFDQRQSEYPSGLNGFDLTALDSYAFTGPSISDLANEELDSTILGDVLDNVWSVIVSTEFEKLSKQFPELRDEFRDILGVLASSSTHPRLTRRVASWIRANEQDFKERPSRVLAINRLIGLVSRLHTSE